MKKTYFFYLLVALFSFGFSQSTIVTIDRANIIGPTTTGHDPSISAIGLTRGVGVVRHTGSSNFSTRNWDATSQASAVANNEYLQWSVSASASNSIEITEFDIRTRTGTSTDGPTNWQVFYSTDDFATAGIPATSVQTASNITTDFNFNGLSILSGIGGKITFRLYAWNSTTTSGWFRIIKNPGWSAYGISDPGLRLIGTITSSTANNTESNIVATSFDPSDNINYSLYSETSGLTISNSIKVGEFSIQDGGDDLTDADAVATILTDLEFGVTNSDFIARLAIFDGITNISETSIVSETATFSGISGISALDNSTKTFDVYATFNASVIDNEQFQLTVNSASADVTGSSFNAFNAGGAQTPITGDDNRIEVIATKLIYDQQPTDTFQFEIMTPFPTVLAVDNNNNRDLDFNTTISVLAAGGSLEPSLINYTLTDGSAILNTLIFTESDIVETLVTFGGGLPAAISNSFNVLGPLITIALQDFDSGSPDWTYSSDVATFDNGWGIDGYYGVIDISNAGPLDYPSFSNNIFGENDLNDEGENGSSGFATLTFDTIDISTYNDVALTFDWDVHGYVSAANCDAEYRLIYDGIPQPVVFLLNGNGEIDTDEGTVSVNIPNSVNAVSLIVRVRNDGETGYSGFDNFKLTSVFDGLLYTNNGWTPNAPSTSTGSEDAYVLDGTYNVGTDIVLNRLFINNGATTTVSAGQSITSNSGVINNGVLELNSVSTSYSSLISDNVNGEVVYNRHVNQFASSGSSTGNNDLISAPVTNADQTFLVLRTANPDMPSGTIGGVPSFLFGPFDNNANTYINYTAADDNSVITSGIGYRTASTEPTGSTFEFVGNAETGAISTPISVGTGSEFNLVGNPYPSYISLSSFLASNSSEFSPSTSGVYGYDGDATDGFTIWNQAYSDANPTAKITPGQGFLVASKAGGGTIAFTPDMRTKGTTDDFIAGRFANLNLAHMKLQLSKGNSLYNTDLYFNDNASLGMDPGYDSAMFDETTPAFAMYSHLVENNFGKDMAVQSVSYSDIDNVTIPLGINIAQGEQATVSIFENNIPEGITVILEDNVTNTFTNLLEGDYIFTPTTTLSETGRFYIHFSNTTLNTTENILNGLEIYTNANPKEIVVKGQLESKTTLQLYDIQGRLVNTQLLNTKDTKHTVDVSNLSAGVYVVQLLNNFGNRTQKVILK
ncbi:T9SS type A sorting domain-containing protein [uncultured Winogradskyella sp.]|uniref:T9SS type A sorting domain-containing protein n=1 Tax=uncultured Winogradskyella sp. TaxID=395353 RepID=UPI00262D08CE|nr:T9SS type A sorting domain-containing protein [uncultured Winogradskyella sp.]